MEQLSHEIITGDESSSGRLPARVFTWGRVCLKTGEEGDNKHALGSGAPVGQRSQEGHQLQRWEKEQLTAAETRATPADSFMHM